MPIYTKQVSSIKSISTRMVSTRLCRNCSATNLLNGEGDDGTAQSVGVDTKASWNEVLMIIELS